MKSRKQPTFIRRNTFTVAFQELVELYGVPRYEEINPGVFNIVLFPILVGIMFGDVFHGGLLIAVAVGVIKFGKNIEGVYKYRYLVLLMGIFSVYAGLLYNDFASIPFRNYQSCYKIMVVFLYMFIFIRGIAKILVIIMLKEQ